MKFSHSWLKKYLETTTTPQKIAEMLDSLGHEVESLDDPATALQGFVYARVVEREKHPNADRLSLCKVDAGTGELIQVVCGAPNVKANMGVAFASVGTVIPVTSEALKKGTIRNVDSFGMLCSSRELLLGEESDGIMDLGLEYLPGTPLTDIITCDAVYEVSITPNRGDCFSVFGIARDLAAAGIGVLKAPQSKTLSLESKTLAIETPLCHEFSLCLIKGVKNKISPSWLKDLLAGSGQKSISTLVDITNYFCLGYGRPMHVFDADRIKGNLTVRGAKKGEILKGLNDQDYTLDEGVIVIADDTGVLSLAGIMGGRDSAVDEHTTNVLLESALFDPVSIATTGQKLNLTSDSRMRFERGVDAAMILPCLDMAATMIIDLCGGSVTSCFHEQNTTPEPKIISLNSDQVEQKLGINVEKKQIINILESLGCTVEQGEALNVTSPSWRHDLTIPEDLIEEVARMIGYNSIEANSLPLKSAQSSVSREDISRHHLVNRGFLETLNWAFTHKTTADQFTDKPNELVSLKNPISEDFSVMRPSIVSSLLAVAKFNSLNARSNGALFEIAPIYGTQFKNSQTICISGLRFGDIHDRNWLSNTRVFDVFDVKADVLILLKVLGVAESSIQLVHEGPSYYHPGRKGSFKQGNRVLACFGELHPKITDSLHIMAFEIFLDLIHQVKPKKNHANLSNLMPVRRDFAFVLDVNISAQTVINAIKKTNPLIVSVDVFDCYQGPHVGEGKKSLAFSVTLQPLEKSLDDASLTQIHESIVGAASVVGAILR